VVGLAGVTAIAASSFSSLALRNDHTIWAWGANPYGQLGDGTQIDRVTPVQVRGVGSVKRISIGYFHGLAGT
jgi:alpha-tubulin suppressor-like RCC1 family protein